MKIYFKYRGTFRATQYKKLCNKVNAPRHYYGFFKLNLVKKPVTLEKFRKDPSKFLHMKIRNYLTNK